MRCTTHRFLAALLASIAMGLIPQAALGVIIASTNFVDDGGDQSIEGDTSGIGWAADGWTVQNTNLAGGILPIGMSYQVPGGGLVTSGSALSFTGPGLGSAVQRDLAETQDGDDIYISFLTKWESGVVNGNDFVIWYYGSNSGPNIGYKSNEGSGDDGPDFVARTGGSTNQYAPDELEIGETYFVVGHLTKTDPGPGNPYDRYELWVNPGLNDFATPESVSEGASNIADFSTVGVRTHQINDAGAEPDVVLFGAMTIGTTWSDVVPSDSDLLIGDFNSDGVIDTADFQVMAGNMFGHLDGVNGHENGDINFDGRIDLNDFHQFVEDFPAQAGAQSVPEPSAALLGICTLAGFIQLTRSRQRRA